MDEETRNLYLKSLEKKTFQDATFKYLTTANFLEEVNKRKVSSSSSSSFSTYDNSASSASASASSASASSSTNQNIEEISQYIHPDRLIINNNELSVGTIVKREAMKKKLNYKQLSPSDLALVNCGLNCIVDLTRGSLTDQQLLFSKKDWGDIKTLLTPSSITNDVGGFRPLIVKIPRIFTNPLNPEECYWNAKHYQKRASKFNEKTGYELLGLFVDKIIKHGTIFTVSKPVPSEADIIIKIWADLFEVLFFNTGIYIRWGEKGLTTGDTDDILFKLDAKLVLIYDNIEYPVSCVEFAPYSGPKKIKTDRSKLLVEAKTILNRIMSLNIAKENEDVLKIVNIQIMGLEAHPMSLTLAADELYVAHSSDSFMLPSTLSQLKKRGKSIIDNLFDLKHHTLNTVDIIKQTLNEQKKYHKSMKRKMQEDENDTLAPSQTSKLAPTWRYEKTKK